MKRKIVTLTMVASIGMGTLVTGFPSYHTASAESLSELNEQNRVIQEKSSEVESKINQTTEKIEEIKGEQDQVTNELQRIQAEIKDTNAKITVKNQQIDEKNKEIETLKVEIGVIQERIEKRNELLKDRARSYQEGGGNVAYLDVLVGAQSFGDFINRIGAVATILEADQNILKEHNEDKQELEAKQAQVESELADLKAMQQELETLKSTLDKQEQDKNNLMAVLEQEKLGYEEEKLSHKEEQAILANQAQAIEKAIQQEQARQAELKRQQEEEAKRVAEEEAKRKAEEAERQKVAAAATTESSNTQESTNNTSSNNTSSNSTSTSTTTSDTVKTTVPVSAGTWTRPADGYVSSNFSMSRTLMGRTRAHYGVDIAKAGTVPVVAAADGVVTYSGVMNGYGNVIMISHSINGKTYTTLYGHLRSRGVSNMQSVKKGEFIGYMGNTGVSTGQHLHFELHTGPWNGAKSNAVNPVGIVF